MGITSGSLTATSAVTTPNALIKGTFSFSLSGTWAGTVTIERSYDSAVSWLPVNTYTANAEEAGTEGDTKSGALYRVKFTARTSGTAVARLSQ